MLRIECPFCGTRDQDEFRYGGEADHRRPARPEALGDDEWARHLFYRAKVRGVQAERWLHAYGCRQWFLMVRDTASHAIRGACRLDEPAPATPPSQRGMES